MPDDLNDFSHLAAGHGTDGGGDGPRAWVPIGLLLTVGLLAAIDVVADQGAGGDGWHLAFESTVVLVAVGGAIWLWSSLLASRREATALGHDLDRARREAVRWRAQAEDLLRGLGAVIDEQFARWNLTPAEREVALLLVKGFSHKEAAQVRNTSERTVRQQALTVYRKAGLAGRAELAAFFLEDLLLPTTAPPESTR